MARKAIGRSVPRVDAYDKVTGRAKYTDDLADRNALIAKILHSTIANGLVTKIDTGRAEKLPGVVKILTCFDVPDIEFPTAGHPWSTDPAHRDPTDRKLLNRRVRLYGDDIAAVVAEDEVAASRALRAIEVQYEEYPAATDPEEAMRDGVPLLHEGFPNNILERHSVLDGDFDEATKEEGLIRVEGTYQTPTVQHCHIELPTSYAYMEGGRVVVVSSTQIPHIVRRIVGQALGIPWGMVRIIKPYIGGGFGNKQDALYEPLNAWLSVQLGGRLVKLELSREEAFYGTRVRHAVKVHITSYVRPDGRIVARDAKFVSNQGAYGSHGHSIVSKCVTAFRQLYNDERAKRAEAVTVYTNTATSGAMRGYGTPQSVFGMECHADDIAARLGIDPMEFRRMNMMPVGYTDPFSKNVNWSDSFNQCIEKGREYIGWDRKRELYRNQSGPVRRGVGMSLLWYNTAVWPISMEVSSCRMVLNQDGSVQIQLGETEIGQGADTVFAQMTADTLGVPFESVHVVSTQDTDITPFGTGAYGSRQTYVGGMAIKRTAESLKGKILRFASERADTGPDALDIDDGFIVRKGEPGSALFALSELATDVLYSMEHSMHFTAEETVQAKSNAYSFGAGFAEVEVDIPLAKVRLVDIVNVHDCGRLINPQLAAAQVHGGMSMGIGYGLYEKMLYDPGTGKLLNDNLLDYKLSTIMDHPHLEALFVENPEPTSAFGTKALGEPPTVPCAPAIRNAVFHATGVAANENPLTPHVLFPLFKAAGLIG
ncbi:MAG: xanthine dehydrogenase molybdenum-binding subunit XdhA [Synergistaceae bacterium]|jgi:xanthine dehydrogenase molybdenum-binding subunit|nr:xanthine dehydrogenase molybdenum-binding subunit XdhA [Synergistaceae bacterium]